MEKLPVIFLVVVIAFSAVFLISDGDTDKVPNCWDETEECSYVELNSTIESCNDWYVDNPLEQLRCNMTGRGVEEVSIVTDPGNHVRGEFTRREVSEKLYNLSIEYQKDMEFLSSGEMIIAASGGRVLEVDDGEISEEYSMEPTLEEENILDNRSIIIEGMALDPDFRENNRVFIFYGLSDRIGGFQVNIDHRFHHFRVDSFKVTESGLELERNIMEMEGALFHSGGDAKIGPDKKLYIAMGDAFESHWAQSFENLRGKILRTNLDGSVPESNPFNDSYIYTLGHRNPQGIAWNPENGNMWSSEHGNKRHDEVNLIRSGNNYGWGRYTCGEIRNRSTELAPGTGDMVPPKRCFRNWTMAPSRMTFVDDPSDPWYGDLLLAGLRGKHVRKFEIENETIVDEKIVYLNENAPARTGVARRLRDIEYRNGSVYLLGDSLPDYNASGLIRLDFPEDSS